ncbi:hypothetical protein [Thetidibacter halocola]|uniref:Uncharacterized protein n=1 Tax=Thetidibacter halocola TaxID=2827239 RepID=A0A8J8BBM4_9RHOB|nr:hypothetical protein [Thetidibacter halocola]MBS0126378.1 hypothetical protein [Thetidibacter halocola]
MTPTRALGRAVAALALCIALPGPALAATCDTLRPLWDPTGGPANALDEALHMAASPVSLVLLLVTALAVRLRNQWVGLAAVCGWSILASLRVFAPGGGETTQMAATEGCIASPALFIAVVAAICVATILYTAPSQGRTTDQEK